MKRSAPTATRCPSTVARDAHAGDGLEVGRGRRASRRSAAATRARGDRVLARALGGRDEPQHVVSRAPLGREVQVGERRAALA